MVQQFPPVGFPGCEDEFRAALIVAEDNLTQVEVEKWLGYGRQIETLFFPTVDQLKVFFNASPHFFSGSSFDRMEGWVSDTLMIGRINPQAALAFLDLTPANIESGNLLHFRELAGMVREILLIDPVAEGTVLSFLRSGIRLLDKVNHRIFQAWYNTGIRLMRKSAAMAAQYFSTVSDDLMQLYQTEMRKVFELTAVIGRELPGKAVEFFHLAPGRLLNLNPNVRERVLDATRSLSGKQPAEVQVAFSCMTNGLAGLPYPEQETVLRHEKEIESLSKIAVRVYFDNAADLLQSVQPFFFRLWVAEGCRLLSESERQGLDYFEFKSIRAQDELRRWQKAVFLEENEKLLSAYARALCGGGIQFKVAEKESDESGMDLRRNQEESGVSLVLPSYIADEESFVDNFRIYKAVVAHQAGYIEFGTFGPGFDKIASGFAAFPQPDLIRDLFFILENRRIDYCLRSEYRGLCGDLDLVLDCRMRKRGYPDETTLHLALECLLRLVYGRLSTDHVPNGMEKLVQQFREALDDFYTPRTGIDHIFLKAVEIHDILKPLIPEDSYSPFESFDFLEMPDLEMMQEGDGEELGDELKSGEDEGGFGVDLTEEEMERLKELLQDIVAIEPVEKGKGGKGFVIEGLTAQVIGKLEELADDEPRPEDKVVVSDGLKPLTTRKGPFFYDEWDYLQKAYRSKWCCLREIQVEPAETGLYDRIHAEYNDLIQSVKRQFQRIRPEELERIKRLEWGTEIDFNAMIQNVVDRKIGDTPSDRIFSRREKKRRRISTFLLIDMSASTDRLASSLMGDGNENGDYAGDDKRIIDIEIESLVVMAEALESLDDSFAIFGFSGYGKEQVELFSIKDFSDPYSRETKNRICGIQPRKSTRMGPAVRHAASRLKETDSDFQLLIMLSDGYPQDMNYGEDRTSQTYALHDTMMALVEAKRTGIRPFCITIDRCGDDYLKQMIDPGSYLVIEDIYSLPAVLPRVVESLMG